MATDFFERQSAARRNTKWLVAMFVLAVIGIVGSTFLAMLAVGASTGGEPSIELGLAAAVGALLLIIGGSLYKTAQLRGGGTVLAERLGGRRVYPNTTDNTERRLLNVVEEMALASGVPVPPVFMLGEEQGINAFAAGHSPSDAVLGVTRGCAESLSRDELQGVIAHEFSHILNGDMRLNLRLIGVLHGILLMGLVGREILRIAGRGGGRSKKKGGIIYVALAGLAFMVIGFLGMLFGNLIKAAVSRQREFLADASAVQFTRNPLGLAGALKRIGFVAAGSNINNPRAAEASHMFFASGLSGLFATHPPLVERIRRLEPQWDGEYVTEQVPQALPQSKLAGVSGLVGESESPQPQPELRAKSVPLANVQHAAEQVAHPTDAHREYVRDLLAAMPQPILEAAHDPYGARAIIFATLLDRDANVRAAQLAALEKVADGKLFEFALRLVPAVAKFDVRGRLPLVDMSLPALRAMSRSQYNEFAKCFDELVGADERVGLFEWTLQQVFMRHLRPQFEPIPPRPVKYYGLQRLAEPCSVLLTALARECQHDDELAFSAGARHLPELPVHLLHRKVTTLREVSRALGELAQTAPKLRQRLVGACAACISADAAVSVGEGELLRAVCDMLDCPLPPLLSGQDVRQNQRRATRATAEHDHPFGTVSAVG
jgi:Zn-dependent protease with chaperone function